MKNTYKYVALDLDSTLLTSKKTISPYTLRQLDAVKDKTHIILCSSRSAHSTKYISEALNLNEPIISFNGAITLDSERKIIDFYCLDMACVRFIMDLCSSYCLELMLYTKDSLVITEETKLNKRWLTDILPLYQYDIGTRELFQYFRDKSKIEYRNTCLYTDIDIIKMVILPTNTNFNHAIDFCEKNSSDLSINYNITPRYIEITPREVDKSIALRKLLDDSQDTLEDVLAIGDNMNDENIIKYSGLGVAMGNSIQLVKNAANIITDSNDNDGVGKILNRFFRGE
jgi:Cof subfamily protein (haloacid dehalogenase superfamily)